MGLSYGGGSLDDLAATATNWNHGLPVYTNGGQAPFHYTPQGTNLESILPQVVLDEMLQDHFIYIHPLAPLPHRPSFEHDYHRMKAGHVDVRSAEYLRNVALSASMVGILVASFPRRPLEVLKKHGLLEQFPSHKALIYHCHEVAVKTRNEMSFPVVRDFQWNDAVTTYFLALSHAYMFDMPQGRFYFAQCLDMVYILLDRDKAETAASGHCNFISEQIGRRMFWIMVVGFRYVSISFPV